MEPLESDGWEVTTNISDLRPGVEFAQFFGDVWNYGVIISEKEYCDKYNLDILFQLPENRILARWGKHGVSWNFFDSGPIKTKNLHFKYDPNQTGDTEDDI